MSEWRIDQAPYAKLREHFGRALHEVDDILDYLNGEEIVLVDLEDLKRLARNSAVIDRRLDELEAKQEARDA